MPLQKSKLFLKSVRSTKIVCIHPCYVRAVRQLQAQIQRGDEPSVGLVRNNFNPCIALSIRFQNSRRAVCGAVVNDYELKIIYSLIDDTFQGGREILFAVI